MHDNHDIRILVPALAWLKDTIAPQNLLHILSPVFCGGSFCKQPTSTLEICNACYF